MAVKAPGTGYDTARSVAARTMPAAMGCSERLSSAAATRNTSRSLRPSSATTSVTPKWPSVSVPVLSNTIASSWRARSNAARSRIKSPLRADNAVDTATTNGTARPRACGQVITMTVTMRSSAKLNARPAPSHATSVTVPQPTAMRVSHMAARFARSCVRERVS